MEELCIEKEELENKLFAAESGFKEALNAMHSASSDPGKSLPLLSLSPLFVLTKAHVAASM